MVLVVDDDPGIRRAISRALEAKSYTVFTASDAAGALHAVRVRLPDVVLLDLKLPGATGLSLLAAIREASTTQVIVLTVLDDEATKVGALESGADDYLTKPFSIRELEARIRTAIRHSVANAVTTVLSWGPLTLDAESRQVTLSGEPVRLTRHEYALFVSLLQRADRVVPRSELLNAVWGRGRWDEGHVLRSCIQGLREKLEPLVSIANERGVGYRLALPPEAVPEAPQGIDTPLETGTSSRVLEPGP